MANANRGLEKTGKEKPEKKGRSFMTALSSFDP
jgi:hypothetical protein